MEKELLRLLLNYEFYNENKTLLIKEFFPKNIQPLYDLIIVTHEKLKRDLTITEIKELYRVNNPTITKAAWETFCIIFDDLPSEISADVAKEILKKAFVVETGRRLAEIGLEIVNGREIEIEEIKKIIEEISTGSISREVNLEAVTDDIEEILAGVSVTTKWKYNIPDLHTRAVGIGPGIFKGAFGRVETGKTAYGVSLCAAPGGFAEQGAVVFFMCNEEAAVRTKLRAVSSWTGLNAMEIQLNIESVKKDYAKVRDKLKFFDSKGMDLRDAGTFIKKHKPDIVIFDQLDKFSIGGNFAREDERLGALYIRARDILMEADCAGIALSQANADTEGKAYMASSNMANARTSKAAELDVLIGIGKSPEHEDMTRVLNIIKNKIQGIHNQVICRLIPEISRYVG